MSDIKDNNQIVYNEIDDENINEILIEKITEINNRLLELDNILSGITVDRYYDLYINDKKLSKNTINILNTVTKKYHINNLNKIINSHMSNINYYCVNNNKKEINISR